MKKKLIALTDELWAAIDAARGDIPRNSWLESKLRRTKAVRDAAKSNGITFSARPVDGRGRWERQKGTEK